MAKKGKPRAKANIKRSPNRETKPKTQARVETKTATQSKSSTRSSRKSEPAPVHMPFGRMNYMLMIAGVVVLALGFFLMSLDPFIDAKEFSISLYIAPVVVVVGFVGIIYAIMYKPKAEAAPASTVEGS